MDDAAARLEAGVRLDVAYDNLLTIGAQGRIDADDLEKLHPVIDLLATLANKYLPA